MHASIVLLYSPIPVHIGVKWQVMVDGLLTRSKVTWAEMSIAQNELQYGS